MPKTPAQVTTASIRSLYPSVTKSAPLAFYGGTLGFEVRRDATFGADQRWLEVAPAGAETTVALPPPHPGVETGVDTGLRLATPDAGAAHDALEAAGADVDELLDFPGAPLMFFLRRSRWQHTRDRGSCLNYHIMSEAPCSVLDRREVAGRPRRCSIHPPLSPQHPPWRRCAMA